MAYQISLTKRTIKALEKIPDPNYSEIKKAIYSLADNPRPQGYLKLKGRNAYRIRVSDYRIIYEIIDNKLIVNIIALGHRKNIYE